MVLLFYCNHENTGLFLFFRKWDWNDLGIVKKVRSKGVEPLTS